jgi:cobalt-zinc-cadmium efflux system membrane fusion protein
VTNHSWVTALLFAASAAACTAEPPGKPASAEPAAPPVQSIVVLDAEAQKRGGVKTEVVKQVTRFDAAEAPGIVALNEGRTARIGSLVDGIVVDVAVQPGARVHRNQQLASLHSHSVHDSWAGYRKAKADERRLLTEVRYATEAEARAQRLYDARAISLQDLQRAQANRVAADESLDIGRTELRRSEEELEHLGITNGEDPTGESGEQIPVLTPFAGVVLERLITQGTAVTPGMPMFVVSDLSTVWVLAELDEAHLAGAQIGRPVTLRLPAYPNESFTGKVTYIGETVNPKTRRVTVRCEIPNSNGRLRPEMYTTVEIGESEPRTTTVVPATAVQTLNGQPTVFISDGNDRFVPRPIDTGAERDGQIEVRRGVQPGERVVTAGAFVLKSEFLKSSADAGE